MPKDITIPLYNAHDGIRGRDGGPYYDQEERWAAEKRRARIEGREPVDYYDTPATAGTPLVPANLLVDNIPSNPSMAVAPGPDIALTKLADDPNVLVNPVAEVTVPDLGAATPEAPSREGTDRDNVTNVTNEPSTTAATPVVSDNDSAQGTDVKGGDVTDSGTKVTKDANVTPKAGKFSGDEAVGTSGKATKS